MAGESERAPAQDPLAQAIEFAETRAQALEAGAESLRSAGEFFAALAKMARAQAAMMQQAQTFNEAMRAWTPPLPPFPMLPPGTLPDQPAGEAGQIPPLMDPMAWFRPWFEMYRPRDPS